MLLYNNMKHAGIIDILENGFAIWGIFVVIVLGLLYVLHNIDHE